MHIIIFFFLTEFNWIATPSPNCVRMAQDKEAIGLSSVLLYS